jgi:hypothetical protein NreA
MKHASHPNIVVRLKRAQGHLGSILTMFDDARSCVELAQQLHAVENAISNAKRELIHDHIEHCLGEGEEQVGMDPKAALREFKALSKYL